MKMLKISLLAVAFGLMSFSAITPVKTMVNKVANYASVLVWKSETIDVGSIPQGTPKPIVFEFKNTGKTPVILTNVQGTVTATYNAAAMGAFTKTVTVTSNAETTPKVLTIKGTVVAATVKS